MIYLDNAATSFQKPEQVARTVYDTMVKYGANAGRGGHALAVRAGELVYEARETVCRLLGIRDVERLAFCQNATYALNLGMKGVIRPGDHIILTSMEHNSVLRPAEALRRCGTASYTVVRGGENGELALSDIRRAIRPETRLLVMTHASNVCGNVYDIGAAAELAHENGILLMVDAAQSAGILDIDAEKVDLLAFPGHKGLLGPQGTGGLYVRRGLELSTVIEGGTGSMSELYVQPEEYPDRLESGTQNVPAIAGLGAGAAFLLREGLRAVREKEGELARLFLEGVGNIPGVRLYGVRSPAPRTGVVALNIEGVDCVEAAERLDREFHIAVRSGLHCAVLAHETLGTREIGCIRFSFGYFNTRRETQQAVYALSRIAGAGAKSEAYPENPLRASQ